MRGLRSHSAELKTWRGLVWADGAGLDLGFRVVLAANGRAGQTPQHADLSYVSERIGDRALKKLFGAAGKRFC
jgi:hypothetical protein